MARLSHAMREAHRQTDCRFAASGDSITDKTVRGRDSDFRTDRDQHGRNAVGKSSDGGLSMTKRVSPRHVSINGKPDRNRHGKRNRTADGLLAGDPCCNVRSRGQPTALAPDAPPPSSRHPRFQHPSSSHCPLSTARWKKVRRLASIDDTGRSCWQRRSWAG